MKKLLAFAAILLVAFSVMAQPVQEKVQEKAQQTAQTPTTQVFVDSLGREVELPVDIQKVAGILYG